MVEETVQPGDRYARPGAADSSNMVAFSRHISGRWYTIRKRQFLDDHDTLVRVCRRPQAPCTRRFETVSNLVRPCAAIAAPVAQLDRALPSEGRGREFESRRVRHDFNNLQGCRRTVSGPSDHIATSLVEIVLCRTPPRTSRRPRFGSAAGRRRCLKAVPRKGVEKHGRVIPLAAGRATRRAVRRRRHWRNRAAARRQSPAPSPGFWA